MNAQELAKQVNEAIAEWSQHSNKLIIAIDGYTGIGKTTLLNSLVALNLDILPVNRDDFLFSRKIMEEKFAKVNDKSEVFEREACDDQKLIDLVSAFRNGERSFLVKVYDGVSGKIDEDKTFDLSKKVMVVEGVFMFHPELSLNKLWDKRIYLKGDINKIDERRIKREKERWGKDYFPETHPDSYFRQVTIALKRYAELYKPEAIADLVLDVD
jgi:uridine kinase